MIYKRGREAHYTQKFDLSGLPHYQPKQVLTGWVRLHGNNYLSDGLLGELWQQGFARYQPGIRLSYYLPTSALAFAALYYDQADLVREAAQHDEAEHGQRHRQQERHLGPGAGQQAGAVQQRQHGEQRQDGHQREDDRRRAAETHVLREEPTEPHGPHPGPAILRRSP